MAPAAVTRPKLALFSRPVPAAIVSERYDVPRSRQKALPDGRGSAMSCVFQHDAKPTAPNPTAQRQPLRNPLRHSHFMLTMPMTHTGRRRHC